MSGEVTTVLWISLQVATLAVALALVPAVGIGWWLARRQARGKALLEALVMAPLVLPPVVTGYLLLVLFGRTGVVGRWLEAWLGVELAYSRAGAVLAAAVVAFPLVVRPVRVAFALVDVGLEQAAATLGASPWRVFRTVTLPLAWPGIASGVVLGLARALGEFGATITFAGNIPGRTQTLPLAIYTATQTPGGEGRAAALVVLAVALSLGALMVAEGWVRRRATGRGGR